MAGGSTLAAAMSSRSLGGASVSLPLLCVDKSPTKSYDCECCSVAVGSLRGKELNHMTIFEFPTFSPHHAPYFCVCSPPILSVHAAVWARSPI